MKKWYEWIYEYICIQKAIWIWYKLIFEYPSTHHTPDGYIFNTSGRHLAVPKKTIEDTLWEAESFKNETTPYKVLWKLAGVLYQSISYILFSEFSLKWKSCVWWQQLAYNSNNDFFELRVYLDFCQPLHCSEIVFALAQHNIT